MKRFTATEKWQKDWFQSLTPGQKCLWNYLCDNCDAAGVWEPNWRLASFVINETFTTESLAAFGDRVCTLPDGKIWLTGFCEFQYSQLSRECRAHTHIIRILEKHGLLTLVEHLIAGTPDNPSDTLWYRVADRDKEKEQEQDKDKEQDQLPTPPNPKLPPAHAAPRSRPRPRATPGPRPGKPPTSSAPSTASILSTASIPSTHRIGAIMRRRPGSRWSDREQTALAALLPLPEDDLLLIERYYAADVPPADDIRRRDLLTLLNHWPGELDRARAFWRKRGWRQPAAPGDTTQGPPAAGPDPTAVPLPAGFAAWKTQAPEYAGTEWRDWSAVPSFAREEFHRWKKAPSPGHHPPQLANP